MLTRAEAKYLLQIMRMLEEGEKPRTTTLARRLGIKPASVTEILRALGKKGMIEYRRYKELKLTRRGLKVGKNLLRGHRLLEVLFVNFLGYDVKTACQEASRLDYFLSSRLANAICRKYGHPSKCPCGKRIFENTSCRRG